MQQEVQVIIVGAGPAGIASAIYLHRAGRSLILLERGELGGLLRNANLVENYPGFPNGIKGSDLVQLFSDQLNHLGVEVKKADVKRIEQRGDGFKVSAIREAFESKSLILATGTRPTRFGLPGADGLVGKRVFFEVVDMPLTRISGKRVVVVGAGDAAFDYGLNLVGRGADVSIAARSDPRCLSLLKARADASGVNLIKGVTADGVKEVNGEVSLNVHIGKKRAELTADYVLVACGREPNLEVLDSHLASKIGKGQDFPRTKVPGLFVAGDVVRERQRQTAIAVGDGVRAAMMADEFLDSKEGDR